MTDMAPGFQIAELWSHAWDVLRGLLLVLIPAIGAWLIKRYRDRRRRHAADAELLMAASEGLRVSLDTIRALLERFSGDPDQIILDPEEWLQRTAVLRERNDDARNRLWIALGYPDPRQTEITAAERRVLADLTRTMRLQVRDMDPGKRAAYLEIKKLKELHDAGIPAEPSQNLKDQVMK